MITNAVHILHVLFLIFHLKQPTFLLRDTKIRMQCNYICEIFLLIIKYFNARITRTCEMYSGKKRESKNSFIQFIWNPELFKNYIKYHVSFRFILFSALVTYTYQNIRNKLI